MESKMQARYDSFEDKFKSVDPFIDDLLYICRKHKIDNERLDFVNSLFSSGYMPKLGSE